MKPVIAITLGDPAGVGPQVVARALADPTIRELATFCVYGDPFVLDRACAVTGLQLDPAPVDSPDAIPTGAFGLKIVEQTMRETHRFGKPDPQSGTGVLKTIEGAVADARAGRVQGTVTAPINKEFLSAATGRTEGHTELLARLTGAAKGVMMLAGPSLRVVSATSHAAVADLPALLTEELVFEQGRLLHEGLMRFFCEKTPRIAVCSLNPHRGEGGLYGDEEQEVIAPAIERLCASGIDAIGPEPADTVFVHAARGGYDAVLAMYHDQAMIPIKLLHFDEAVNVTLGLPIVRTSPAHGTAYDIAGSGKADARSMKSAIRLAASMACCEWDHERAVGVKNR